MATRSVIAIQHSDNTYTSVYCHWDGYLAHNGAILQEHYNSAAKAAALIELGNISSLGPIIGEAHPFSRLDVNMTAEEFDSKYGKMTTYYGRDRGEKDTEPKTSASTAELVEQSENSWCEYLYIHNGERWFVIELRKPNEVQDLATALDLMSEEVFG